MTDKVNSNASKETSSSSWMDSASWIIDTAIKVKKAFWDASPKTQEDFKQRPKEKIKGNRFTLKHDLLADKYAKEDERNKRVGKYFKKNEEL